MWPPPRKKATKTVPCVFAENLTEAQKRAYILADNRLAMNAGWDEEMLAVELSDLQADAFDVSLLGFTDAELNKLSGAAENVKEDDFDIDEELKSLPSRSSATCGCSAITALSAATAPRRTPSTC